MRNLAAVAGLDRPTRAALQDINRRLGDLEPEAWKPFVFQNGWSNYGSGFQPCEYRKVGDLIMLRGLAAMGTAATGTVICNLPTGYRPPLIHLQATDATTVFGRFDVNVNGNITYINGPASGYMAMNATFSVTK